MKHRVIRSALAACAAAAPVVGLATAADATSTTADGCTATANTPTLSNGSFVGTGSGVCSNNRHRQIWATIRVDQSNGTATMGYVQGPNTPGNITVSVSKAAVDKVLGACTGTRKVFTVVQIGVTNPTIVAQSDPTAFSCK